MAETATAVVPAVPQDLEVRPPAPAPERGALQIEARVYSQIARQAALEVPGVVPQSVTLGSITGRNLPRALADANPRHPAIAVEVAISWPASAAAVSADVQRHVADVLTQLTGRRPARVDVDVVGVAQSELLLSEEIADIVAVQQKSPDPVLGYRDRVPRAYAAAGLVAPLIGVLLLAGAVVLGREYAVADGHYNSNDWIADGARWIADTVWQGWMVAVAIAAIVVGLYLVYLAIRPRRRTHLGIASAPGVWTRDTDIARRLSAIALDDDTTASATTKVARGRAKVTVKGQPGTDGDALQAKLDTAVTWLEAPPRVILDHRAPPAPTPVAISDEETER